MSRRKESEQRRRGHKAAGGYFKNPLDDDYDDFFSRYNFYGEKNQFSQLPHNHY